MEKKTKAAHTPGRITAQKAFEALAKTSPNAPTGGSLRSYLSSEFVDEGFKVEVADALVEAARIQRGLLEAAKYLLAQVDFQSKHGTRHGLGEVAIAELRAAIAKAEGGR